MFINDIFCPVATTYRIDKDLNEFIRGRRAEVLKAMTIDIKGQGFVKDLVGAL